MEEAAKALIYKQAAEGLIRFVRDRPNDLTTYRERDLLNHKFKHGAITRLLVGAIEFAPFQQALASSRRQAFTRRDVEVVLHRAHARAWLVRSELESGGRAGRELQRMLEPLGRLDQMKNDGFYVGPGNNQIRRPNGISRSQLDRVLELAAVVIAAAESEISSSYDNSQRREFAAQLQMLSAQRRRLIRRARGKARTAPAATPGSLSRT